MQKHVCKRNWCICPCNHWSNIRIIDFFEAPGETQKVQGNACSRQKLQITQHACLSPSRHGLDSKIQKRVKSVNIKYTASILLSLLILSCWMAMNPDTIQASVICSMVAHDLRGAMSHFRAGHLLVMQRATAAAFARNKQKQREVSQY